LQGLNLPDGPGRNNSNAGFAQQRQRVMRKLPF
jgi:hypothetical protein